MLNNFEEYRRAQEHVRKQSISLEKAIAKRDRAASRMMVNCNYRSGMKCVHDKGNIKHCELYVCPLMEGQGC